MGDGEIRPALVRMCRELNIIGAVHFLGTRNDVPNLLALMDVVALTSKMEASPVTILEAMAMEKPFVAPRVGSIPETITDGETGYLVEAGDEAGFTRRLVELLHKPEVAKQLGAAARRRVVEQFSLEVMVNGYQDLITQIYLEKLAAQQRRGSRRKVSPALEALQVVRDEPLEEARLG